MKKLPFALLLLLLSACAVATPTPSATLLPMVTSTAQGSNTPTVTRTATATTQPSNTPKPSKTLDATATAQYADFHVACDEVSNGERILSPNGQWIVAQCGADYKSLNLEVLNREGKRWLLELIDYIPKKYITDGTVGPGGLRLEHWSNDSAYLYFSPSLAFSGGGNPCLDSFGTMGVYRLNLNDGSTAAVLPVSDAIFGYFFAFSPTDRRLAYEGLENLTIRDLQTGSEIDTNDWGLTDNPIWSQDGQQLMYITCNANFDITPPEIEKSEIKIFSIQSKTSRTIIEREKGVMSIEAWDANTNTITINTYNDYGSIIVDDEIFDLNTNQFITATPQP